MLGRLATDPYVSDGNIARHFGVSRSTITKRLAVLLGAGLIDEVEEQHSYTVPPAGRAALRICAELHSTATVVDSRQIAVGDELAYLLALLEDRPLFKRRASVSSENSSDSDGIRLRDVLWVQARAAASRWG